MYINEVGNLSLCEANEIDELIQKSQNEIVSTTHLLEHCRGMIDQLKMLDLDNQLKNYNNQLLALLDELIAKYIFLGHCWTYLGDPFSSNEAYSSALKLDQNNADVLTFIGRN